MKNIEKYKEELLLNAIANSIAIHEEAKKIVPCNDLACIHCLFYGPSTNCIYTKLEWLQAEYKEPEVDWSKVEVDTPIYVRDYERNEWVPRHFAKYEDGEVYAWLGGMTSFTGGHIPIEAWTYAKLAEDKK